MSTAAQLDAQDPLAEARQRFQIPEGKIYLDGNSLGALPKSTTQRMRTVVEQQWGDDLIGSWNDHGWVDLPVMTGNRIGALIGSAQGQVLACDSTSVNLFKLLSVALALRPGRTRILSDTGNFPTDLYMAQGLSELLGQNRAELHTAPMAGLADALDEQVAVLMLTHVDFRSGRVLDMARWTELAHESGALVLWDLAHSAGAMPLALDECNVDLAVGCGYKYLNGGPGAPAFLHVAERHQQAARQPLSGWFGHADPFAFDTTYEPVADIRRFLAGTPPILSLCALDAALDAFDGIDLNLVRQKSIQLGEFLLQNLHAHDALKDFELASPADAQARGSHLVLRHPHAFEVCQALIERGVITDFRAPDLLRIGFAPLYVSYTDVARSVEILNEVVSSGAYLEPRFAVRSTVT